MNIQQKLENKLRELIPVRHILLTGFTRNALCLLVKAKEWNAECEVIIPAYTCPVIMATLEICGVRPIEVDAEQDGLNIDPDKFAQAITPRTKAVYVVHTYGTAAAIEKICSIARKKNILVIEDLAHSLGSTMNGKALGTFGDVALLSFTKKIINYEGGALATDDSALFERIQHLQTQLQQERKINLQYITDSYARLIGSWWESGFSPAALVFMKINDFINDIIYKGGYGMSVDPDKYTMRKSAMWLTLIQLDNIFKRIHDKKYDEFTKKFTSGIIIAEYHQNEKDKKPAYYSGIPRRQDIYMKALSFRTWHDFGPHTQHPRAAYLYEHYRIFTRSILSFRKSGSKADEFSGKQQGNRA